MRLAIFIVLVSATGALAQIPDDLVRLYQICDANKVKSASGDPVFDMQGNLQWPEPYVSSCPEVMNRMAKANSDDFARRRAERANSIAPFNALKSKLGIK